MIIAASDCGRLRRRWWSVVPTQSRNRCAPAANLALVKARCQDCGKKGRFSVVLHQTEFVALRIGHDDDCALVVVVSFAGRPSAQAGNELDGPLDIVDGHVNMDADFARLRLGNWLEHQAGLGIAAMAQVDPAVLRRPWLATQQGAPEARDPLGVNAVDGHTRHYVRHVRHLKTAPRCRDDAQDQQNAAPIAAKMTAPPAVTQVARSGGCALLSGHADPETLLHADVNSTAARACPVSVILQTCVACCPRVDFPPLCDALAYFP